MQIKRVKVTKASSKCYWYADVIWRQAMQIKRVKVTKASSKCYWYADKIGNEFYVFNVGHDDDKFKHQVIRVGTYDSLDMSPQVSYLDTEDFEVIEVFDGEIVEQVITSIDLSDKTQCEEKRKIIKSLMSLLRLTND